MTRKEKVQREKEEIKKVFKIFKDEQLDTSNAEMTDAIKDAIKNVFQLEVEELGYRFDPSDEEHNTINLIINDEEKKGYMGGITSKKYVWNGNVFQSNPLIVYNIVPIYEDLQNEDRKKRLAACKETFHNVFHEIQHERQTLMITTDVASKENMLYAREDVLMRYLDESFYRDNYNSFAIENDANKVAIEQLIDALYIRDDSLPAYVDLEEGNFSLNQYTANSKSRDGKLTFNSNGLKERQDVAIPIIDKLVEEHTEILEQYPVLQREYNVDGTKRQAIDLIRDMTRETKYISQKEDLTDSDKNELIGNCKELYYELIYNVLQRNTPQQIQKITKQFGKDNCIELFDEMEKYFKKEFEEKTKKSAARVDAEEKIESISEKKQNSRDKHIDTYMRLSKYYKSKSDFMSDIKTLSLNCEENKQSKKEQDERPLLQQKQDDENMKWIKKFIMAYAITETYYQNMIRKQHEDKDIIQIVDGINNGHFTGDGTSKLSYDPEKDKGNQYAFGVVTVGKMGRLLKVADSLTLDGGENYLEEFTKIPNVAEILNLLKDNEAVDKLFKTAQIHLDEGNVPEYQLTKAEIDKKYAQDYLKRGNLSKKSVEEELSETKKSLNRSSIIVIDGGSKSIEDIPLEEKQRIALMRVIARQQGKIPSELIAQNGKYIMIINTKKQNNIAPKDIAKSTLKVEVTNDELNEANGINKVNDKEKEEKQ